MKTTYTRALVFDFACAIHIGGFASSIYVRVFSGDNQGGTPFCSWVSKVGLIVKDVRHFHAESKFALNRVKRQGGYLIAKHQDDRAVKQWRPHHHRAWIGRRWLA